MHRVGHFPMVLKAVLGNCQKLQECDKLEALFNLPPGKGKNSASLVKGWLSVHHSFPKRQKKISFAGLGGGCSG